MNDVLGDVFSGRLNTPAGNPATWLPAPAVRNALPVSPFQVLYRPDLYSHRWPPAITKQKLTQPMSGAKLILLGRFSGSNHIAQRLVGRNRHPYRRQLSGPIISRSFNASRRSVFTRSPAFTGTSVGATTSHFAPILVSCQYST
jgi:hypothetical protein